MFAKCCDGCNGNYHSVISLYFPSIIPPFYLVQYICLSQPNIKYYGQKSDIIRVKGLFQNHPWRAKKIPYDPLKEQEFIGVVKRTFKTAEVWADSFTNDGVRGDVEISRTNCIKHRFRERMRIKRLKESQAKDGARQQANGDDQDHADKEIGSGVDVKVSDVTNQQEQIKEYDEDNDDKDKESSDGVDNNEKSIKDLGNGDRRSVDADIFVHSSTYDDPYNYNMVMERVDGEGAGGIHESDHDLRIEEFHNTPKQPPPTTDRALFQKLLKKLVVEKYNQTLVMYDEICDLVKEHANIESQGEQVRGDSWGVGDGAAGREDGRGDVGSGGRNGDGGGGGGGGDDGGDSRSGGGVGGGSGDDSGRGEVDNGGGGEGDGGGVTDGERDQIPLRLLKFPPQNWEQWTKFKDFFHCDIDYVSISGSIRILKRFLGDLIQVTLPSSLGGAKKPGGNLTLLVAKTPYHVFVDKKFKEKIVRILGKKRGVDYKPATNENALLYKDITMASTDFIDLLQKSGVSDVTIVGYGQKASIKWGLNLMKVARSEDEKCICEYDFGTHIPPTMIHWPRCDDYNMCPFYPTQDGTKNAFNLTTLIACTNQSLIKRKFGRNSKIDHWPQFPLAQLEQTNFQCIPIYGTFTIIPLKGLQNPNENNSLPPDCDDLDTDEEGSVNYDLDWDGTDGKCNTH